MASYIVIPLSDIVLHVFIACKELKSSTAIMQSTHFYYRKIFNSPIEEEVNSMCGVDNMLHMFRVVQGFLNNTRYF
jgi:hypothetical protein